MGKSDNQVVITVSQSYHQPATCTETVSMLACALCSNGLPVVHVNGPASHRPLRIHAVAAHPHSFKRAKLLPVDLLIGY
jgi:hypothetical protein